MHRNAAASLSPSRFAMRARAPCCAIHPIVLSFFIIDLTSLTPLHYIVFLHYRIHISRSLILMRSNKRYHHSQGYTNNLLKVDAAI